MINCRLPHLTAGFVLICFAALFAHGSAQEKARSPSDREKEIDALIEKLGSDQWDERNQATKDLIDLGQEAMPAVEKAGKSDDPEVRARASMIMAKISQRSGPSSSTVSAKVVAYSKELGAVALNVGRDDGVVEGAVFTLGRNGEKGAITVVVEKVDRTLSVAKITAMPFVPLPGDDARTSKPEIPEWVNAPNAGAAVVKDGDKYYFATGVAPLQGSVFLARTSATNRARVELAARLNLWVAATWKAYAQDHPDLGDGAKQVTESVSRLTTDADLVGSQTFLYWEDREGKVIYALVGLNLDDTVKIAREKIGEAVRRDLKEKADTLPGELEKELDKRKEQLRK